MNEMTASQGIVAALKQLEQFLPVPGEGDAVCALSGARVSAIADPDESNHGMIQLTFPGSPPVEAIGAVYLKLKVIESVRLEFDSASHGDTKVSRRAHELFEHFQAKYDF